ncbi:MAG: sensor histidine kinase, partial [Terriglobia bacterium]
VTERKRLENTILDISAREQRRIGQDLHDGLGQHLTGIAFMSKVLEQKLEERSIPEAAEAAKIVKLVNEAINNTRELARGLLPVVSEAHGLMSALQQWANEVEDLFRISCWFQFRHGSLRRAWPNCGAHLPAGPRVPTPPASRRSPWPPPPAARIQLRSASCLRILYAVQPLPSVALAQV